MDPLYEAEAIMRELADMVKNRLSNFSGPKGFTIIVFDFNNPGVSNYISNGDRKQMIAALRETADRIEENQVIGPIATRTIQ
jgi:GH25 family lysozyme M1 (1,4-beta-N-acetylmuramidase)